MKKARPQGVSFFVFAGISTHIHDRFAPSVKVVMMMDMVEIRHFSIIVCRKYRI
ncbi:hypothetical protein GKG09_28755 [Escherichia coli]|jgi:hypothetical protein|nr:hypothetical protein [Escherichia coli]